MEYNYLQMSSPLGKLHLVSDSSKLVAIIFDRNWSKFKTTYKFNKSTDSILIEAQKQLEEYFNKKRKSFDLPLNLQGTDFQLKAWKRLLKIPYGKTISYQKQAEDTQNIKAVRAIGGANRVNKLAIVVPCHRVISKSGELTGYAGGLNHKKWLLDFESAELK